ncbi:MAG: ATP-binding protein [Solobacterium sp.]|nr:ATP-binding protein [Solobacterium sp.]
MRARRTDTAKLTAVTNRLHNFRMNTMADELIRLDESGELYSEPAIDILDQLTSLQEISSDDSTTARYKKAARLYWPMADLDDVLYIPDRHINIAMIDKLRTNDYISRSLNVLMSSATGCGKTFFACAFGNNACESQYTVRYYTMVDLLYSFREADEKGKYVKFLNKLANTNLIIIDDFLLTTAEQRDVEYLYRLVNSKTRKNKPRSFIICSQLMPAEMYTRLSTVSPSLADGIINRLFAKSYTFEIKGNSMREIDIPTELQRQKNSQ